MLGPSHPQHTQEVKHTWGGGGREEQSEEAAVIITSCSLQLSLYVPESVWKQLPYSLKVHMQDISLWWGGEVGRRREEERKGRGDRREERRLREEGKEREK